MQLVLVSLLTIMAAIASPVDRTEVESLVGTICLASVRDDGDPRGHFSESFSVRIDGGNCTPMPSESPHLIPKIPLRDKHLVSIRDGSEVIESFWFRFEKYETNDLCLWYKPRYRTWSLWNSLHAGRKCNCTSRRGRKAG